MTSPTSVRQCTIDGCEKKFYARGWCQMHYRRWKDNGSPGPAVQKTVPRGDPCLMVDCDRPVHAKGRCILHYQRWNRLEGAAARAIVDSLPKAAQGGELMVREECSVDQCEDLASSRGYCRRHYARWQRHGDPTLVVEKRVCSVHGCRRKHFGNGYCEMHHARIFRRGTPAGPVDSLRSPEGTLCAVDGCDREFFALGHCSMHYSRVRYQGAPGDAAMLGGTSQKEKALSAFVGSLGVEIVCNSKSVIKPLQLDIYILSHGLAIEFNGNYWHRESKVGRERHYAKYLACKEQGIQLLQVWEDQWDERRDVVEAMIRRKVLGGSTGIGARKTAAVALDKAAADAFLEATHIQGGARGSHYVGLEHDGDVVAVGVFRNRGDGTTELSRYASTRTVQGGLGKMMKHVGPGRYVTFADHCVSDGGLYEKTGWTEDAVLAPDYRYLVAGQRVHKFNYRLARFRDDPELLWEDGLTERELAELNGLQRIWDAGKTRYIRTIG